MYDLAMRGFASIAPSMVALLVVAATASCARKREEPGAAASSAAPPPTGVAAADQCRFESATASSSLDVASIVALDLHVTDVRKVVSCSGAPLAECGGKLPAEPARGEVSYTLSVDKRGFVTGAKIDQTTLPATVTSCTTEILKRLQMPAPEKDETKVQVKLAYAKRDDAGRFANARVTPTVQLGAGKVDAPEKAIDAQLGKVRACYLMALESKADAAGRLDYALTLGKDGDVLDANVTAGSGTLTADTVTCVKTVLSVARFAAPGAPKTVVKGTLTFAK